MASFWRKFFVGLGGGQHYSLRFKVISQVENFNQYQNTKTRFVMFWFSEVFWPAWRRPILSACWPRGGQQCSLRFKVSPRWMNFECTQFYASRFSTFVWLKNQKVGHLSYRAFDFRMAEKPKSLYPTPAPGLCLAFAWSLTSVEVVMSSIFSNFIFRMKIN